MALAGEILAYREDLRAGGRHIASYALQSPDAATTVRVRYGRVSLTDGPLGEAQERLCEFCLIDARDLNDVVRIVSQMPQARLGCVEVWPVKPEPGL